ncbi:hypothetical protein B0T17DRAFT_483551, partial [Bombardia bombarda]
QGCCISRPSGPNSPYPGGVDASGSARAINDALQQQPVGGPGGGGANGGASSSQAGGDDPLPSPSSVGGGGSRRHSRHTQSLAQHINRPLRRHEWTSRNRVWTRPALARERQEFFDTRVTGRQEIWQTLRAALEVLWAADADGGARRGGGDGPSEEDPTVALATAQSIITAADITLPTGDPAQGAYDALGNYYSLPEHVVSDPLNVARDGGSTAADDNDDNDNTRPLGDAKVDLTGEEEDETGEDRDEADDEEAERRREEKGKAVMDIRDQITIRARLSDGSRDVNVAVGKGETVRSIARHIGDEAQASQPFFFTSHPHRTSHTPLPPNKKIRVAYMGKILKEGLPLPAQGWKAGHVVNALVFNR